VSLILNSESLSKVRPFLFFLSLLCVRIKTLSTPILSITSFNCCCFVFDLTDFLYYSPCPHLKLLISAFPMVPVSALFDHTPYQHLNYMYFFLRFLLKFRLGSLSMRRSSFVLCSCKDCQEKCL